MGNPGYDSEFYADLAETAGRSAAALVPKALSLVPAESVLDAGCGQGAWLAAFMREGVEDVFGIDGPWVDRDALMIPAERFAQRNLENSLDLDRSFDLAISLEVGEHLTEGRAAGFVAELCAAAPVIMFSAAIPGQGGTDHINERWPDFWATHFEAHGFRAIDALRPMIWDEKAISWVYRQNVMFFASDEGLERFSGLAAAPCLCNGRPMSLIHPDHYAAVAKRADPSFGKWLKMARGAFRKSAAKRGSR